MSKRARLVKMLAHAASILAVSAVIAAAATACVVEPVLHKVTRRFVVVVLDRGRPVQGVSVVATRDVEQPTWHSEVVRSLATDKSGVAPFNDLKPGSYLIRVERAGIETDAQVVVRAGNGRNSKKQLRLEWPGMLVLRTQRFAGQFVGEYLTTEGRPWFEAATAHNLKSGPLASAPLIVRNATSGEVVANGLTDSHGGFEFGAIPPGLYFLHVQRHPGTVLSMLEVDGDVAIEVDPKAERVELPIRLSVSDCGLTYELAEAAGK